MARLKKAKVVRLIVEQSKESIDMVAFVADVLEYRAVSLNALPVPVFLEGLKEGEESKQTPL